MLRIFDKKMVDVSQNSKGRSAYIIACTKCDASETIHIGKPSGSLNTGFLIKKMRTKGWYVGKDDKHDLCPACNGVGAKQKKEIKLEAEVMSNVTPITVKAEAPPVMTKEDRRIIFSKIDENYIDETSGYSAGWNDDKIAKDLNVPRAWVSQIREDNFGPEIGESITKDVHLISEQIDLAKALLGHVNDAIEELKMQYEKSLKHLQSARNSFEDSIRQAAERLNKIAKR